MKLAQITSWLLTISLIPIVESSKPRMAQQTPSYWNRVVGWWQDQRVFVFRPKDNYDDPEDLEPDCVYTQAPGTILELAASVHDPTLRIGYGGGSVTLFAWPSRGGLIILSYVTGVDFTFLGLDPRNPPDKRLEDQDAEDSLCKKLLQLGASWYDSQRRSSILAMVDSVRNEHLVELGTPNFEWPTARERMWAAVGYPSDAEGGLWVLELNDVHKRPEVARLSLARNMDEKCDIMKSMGAKFYKSAEEYEGSAYLKPGAWEEKAEGEVGPLVKTKYPSDKREE